MEKFIIKNERIGNCMFINRVLLIYIVNFIVLRRINGKYNPCPKDLMQTQVGSPTWNRHAYSIVGLNRVTLFVTFFIVGPHIRLRVEFPRGRKKSLRASVIS